MDCGVVGETVFVEQSPAAMVARAATQRRRYLDAALSAIPRLLTAMDRNPLHATYGCLDRQFWHYRTADFPSGMYQEGLLPLAMVFAHRLETNRWYGNQRLRELVIAALRFTFTSGHRDGSCDDYYPFERALGATVFSLVAAAEAYRLLELDDQEVATGLQRRARWVMNHDESGRLSNHQALAGLGLLLAGRALQSDELTGAAEQRIRRLLAWQSDEGWFEEYGGADPGYQTVTIECLARYRAAMRDAQPSTSWLDEPLARAVGFARWFLHADDSYGGEYGSRGTYHYYPHGMELLAGSDSRAADLADGFLRALERGRVACFDDDRLLAHRAGSLLHAWLDWSPARPGCLSDAAIADGALGQDRYFADAGLFVRQSANATTVVSLARGGVVKQLHRTADARTDAGLVVEFEDGRVAVSQLHDRASLARAVVDEGDEVCLVVERPLHFARHETATPQKLILFRLLTTTIGRWMRGLTRRLLQRRLITGRRAAPAKITRTIHISAAGTNIEDQIELTDPLARVTRMMYGVDHESTYVAATGVYQDSVLEPWTDLAEHVERLNQARQVTIRRQRGHTDAAHPPSEARAT